MTRPAKTQAKLVRPKTALAMLSTSTVTCSSSTSLPDEIVTLAASLKCDPNLIYEYVRNSIEYEPLFGSNKGALGTLLDMRGNDIDQVNLMASLLLAANVSPANISIQYGYIRLTGAQVTSWLGVANDTQAINSLLANGGIPTANLTPASGTGPLTSIDIAHVWLQYTAPMGGGVFAYDPSFKPHTINPGLGNLAAAMGYSRSQFLADAGGTISGSDNSISGVNRPSIRGDLTNFANNLVTYIKANNPAWTVNDIVGGKTIQPLSSLPVAGAALPYLSPSQPSGFPQSWGTTIPYAYRTTLQVILPQSAPTTCNTTSGAGVSFYADQTYGHRITVSSVPSSGAYVPTLLLDGANPGGASTGISASAGTNWCVWTIITHPYATLTAANQSGPLNMQAGVDGSGNQFRYLVNAGWGEVGRGMVAKHRNLLAKAQAADPTGLSEAVQGESLAVLGYTWLAENAAALRLRDNTAQVTSQFHHDIGTIAQSQMPSQTAGLVGPYVNTPLNFLTIQPQQTYNGSCLGPGVIGGFFGTWGVSSSLESAVLAQTQALTPGMTVASTVSMVDLNAGTGAKTFMGDSTSAAGVNQYFTAIRPSLVSYSPDDLARVDNAMSSTGAAGGSPTGQYVLIPQQGTNSAGAWSGTGYAVMNPSCAASQLSMANWITGGLSGGSSGTIVPGASLPTNSQALTTPPSASAPIPAGAVAVAYAPGNPLANNPVDSIGGAYVYSHTDLTTGGGGSPYALTFSREYSSASNGVDTGLGSGWTHNFSMGVSRTSDPYIGLGDRVGAPTAPTGHALAGAGESNAIATAQAIVATYVTQDLLGNGAAICAGGAMLCQQSLTVSSIGFKWMTDQLTNNAALVSQPTSSGEYTWLPHQDGATTIAYNPPPGAAGVMTGTAPDATGAPTVFNFMAKDQSRMAFTPVGGAGNGQISSISMPYGVAINFAYDGANHLTRVSNSLGRSLNLTYSGAQVSGVSDDTGRSVSFGYTTIGSTAYLIAAKDPLGNVTSFAYDGSGAFDTANHLTQIYYPSRPGIAFVTNWYDALGRISQQADAKGALMEFYVAGSRTEIVNNQGARQVSYQTPRGLVTRQAAVLSGNATILNFSPQSSTLNVVTSAYDGQDRLILSTAPEGGTTSYTYSNDLLQNLLAVTQTPKPGSPLAPLTTTYAYDLNFNTPIRVTDPKGLVSIMAYDQGNGLLTRTIADYGGTGHQNVTTRFTYGAYGQLATSTDPLGAVTAMTYDAQGNLTALTSDAGRQNVRATATYDSLGNVLTATDPRGATTSMRYDAARRLIDVIAPNAGSAAGPLITSFSYDADGQLLNTQQGTAGGLLASTSTTYTPTGNVETSTDPKGNVTRYTYDLLDRVLSVTDPTGVTTSVTYDALNRTTAAYNRAIQANPLVQQAYTPDGLVLNQTVARGNTVADKTGYAYDGLDRAGAVTYPDASTEAYTYDADSNVLTRKTRKGDTIAFGYDTLNRLVAKTPPSPAPAVTYTYDQAGNLVGVSDTSAAIVKPSSAASYTVSNTYDVLNRPTSSSWSGAAAQTAPTATSVTFTHGYDADDRRISQGASDNTWLGYPAAASTTSYTTNSLNQYSKVGTVTPTYDGNGALTCDGGLTYAYDAESRLTGVSTLATFGSCASTATGLASYAYDAQSRRKLKTVGAAKTIYVTGAANDAALDYDGATGAILRWYPPGGMADVAGGARQTFIPDIEGSTIGLLSSSGALTRIGYLPFGEHPGLTPDGMRYTGQQLDSETAGSTSQPSGLYYLRARQYAPGWGRFLTPDPAKSGTNWYAYANNSPLNLSDPSGLDDSYACSFSTDAAADGCEVVYELPSSSAGGIPADQGDVTVIGTCNAQCQANRAIDNGQTVQSMFSDLSGSGGQGAASGGGGGGDGSSGGSSGATPVDEVTVVPPKSSQPKTISPARLILVSSVTKPQTPANRQPANPQRSACIQAAIGDNAVSLGLDVVGLGLGLVDGVPAAGAALVVGAAAMVNSAAHGDLPGIGIGATGYHVTAFAPFAAKVASSGATTAGAQWAKLVPGVGIVVSGIGLAHDAQGTKAAIDACYAKYP